MELNLDTKEISYHNYAAGHYLKNLLYLPFDEVLQYLKINAEGQLIQSGERETFIGDKAFEITTFKLSGDSLCRVYLHDITLRKQNEIQLSELIEQLKMTESALVQKTQQLEASLSELEKAQSDILNKERLSTLGVLIAGIAHEINSPLGAIKASGENLNRLFDDCFNDIIPFLPPEDLSLSIQLFKKRKLLNLSTKEERERNRQIDAFLKADIPDDIDRHTVTRILVQMGYTTVDDETSRIIKHVNATNILRLALNFVLMQKSIVTTTISSDQSSKVVRALNTFAHGNINEEISTFSLKDNIETVITIFWNKIKQGANVRNNVPDDIRITGMADEITQVWTNLINNALYASNNKCNITIDYHSDDIFHVVTVSNDGPQIPENVITRIFEPFFTTKSRGEGTGLGLNIVQRVMEKHKGKISCISNAQNTSFIVSIPKNDHLG
jgi:two-component system NtrC family sensor kinase